MTTEPATASTPPVKRRRGFLIFLRDVLVIVLIAALVSFVVKTFVVRSFYIPSASMEQTLMVNDRILVDELTPHWTGYERGDVVVFKDPGGWLDPQPQTPAAPPLVQAVDWVLNLVGISATDSQDHLVKRIIGLPGDHVVCCNALGQITINGTPIDELSYLNLPQGDTAASNAPFDVVVPKDSLWLLGDNRDRSRDSREHQDLPSGGFVPLANVVGKAFLTTWPLNRFGTIDGHHDTFNGVPDPE
ncbi:MULTISPECIES: signal peptidase I [unclassified Microbacterium]|jgi:signal peptidase I|uniref:signal peptidase I n=1 Tax=unclassified Microbacterium TaxID=2609290 RepID=UPI000CFDBE89|nr:MULTISPECIES: signal peptidase I [unclassified Microbacterium]PRB11003.1 signal peptidase I [Microbacterium sp. MYb72]